MLLESYSVARAYSGCLTVNCELLSGYSDAERQLLRSARSPAACLLQRNGRRQKRKVVVIVVCSGDAVVGAAVWRRRHEAHHNQRVLARYHEV